MSAFLRYIGKDKGSIPGIPARNLEEKEAKDIGVQFLLESGLYVLVSPPYEEMEKQPPAPAGAAEETTEEPATEEAKPRRQRRRKE